MTFRTRLHPLAAPFQINHQHKLLLIGSCFTEHIGTQLAERKFKVLANPFGIVYNPHSIEQQLQSIAAGNQPFTAAELFENAGLWHSWQHHGRFSKPDPTDTLEGINQAYTDAVDFLQQADILMLTLGTSEVYSLKENGQIVANNHKMPAAYFDSGKLSVSEIVEKMAQGIEKVKTVSRPNLKVMLTVSPVRHLRLGPVENQRSKARLLLACEELAATSDQVYYFPAYELLLDDLRDYRFYAADMLHPSEVAVKYIWQFFEETFFSEPTQRLNERIEKIRMAALHRPFHADTPQHQAFLQAQRSVLESIRQEMPGLDFSFEASVFGT